MIGCNWISYRICGEEGVKERFPSLKNAAAAVAKQSLSKKGSTIYIVRHYSHSTDSKHKSQDTHRWRVMPDGTLRCVTMYSRPWHKNIRGRAAHLLFHVTSLDRLVSIVRAKQFIPKDHNECGADSGLNTGIVGHPLAAQEIEARGVKLLLEFYGPLLKPPPAFPRSTGAIYDELAWRVTVPYGTSTDLVMIGLEFEPGHNWLDVIPIAPQWLLLRKLKNCWREKKALQLEHEIRAILEQKPLLRIG